MRNKQTGPITSAGKQTSSRNAVKHGATSPQLINSEEQDRYNSLLVALKDHYKSSNPLVQLQIERIARVNVQLERIQNVIDASIKRSRKRAYTAKKLIDSFEQGNEILELLARGRFGGKDIFDAKKSQLIAAELLYTTNLDLIKSNDDFIKKLPLLTEYLLEKSSSVGKSIKEFLITEVSNFSESHKKFCDFLAKEEKILNNPSSDQDINDVDIRLLYLFAGGHEKFLKDLLYGPEYQISTKEAISLEEQAMLPEGDEMDRLMRYQTSLQRQLSSAVGELIAIHKMDSPS